ncbi:MAG: (Fe-S)-binding protein [Desulfovibrio sp.]
MSAPEDRNQAAPAQCILCGKCLAVCPLLAATGREELAPRAKARLAARLLEHPEALDGRDAAQLAALCLGCGRCVQACGQGVEPPAIVARLRAAHPGWREWLWKQWIGRAEKIWPPAFKAGKYLGRAPESLFPGRFGALLKSLRGLDRPHLDAYVRLTARPKELDTAVTQADGPCEVLLFSGCAGRFARPDWDASARRLLAFLGLPRLEADFACCGSTLGSAGLLAEQRAARERNVEIWRAAGRPPLLAYCASCVQGLARYAGEPELFEDAGEAALWRARVMPLSRLLKSARFVVSDDAPGVVGYHRPCHASEPDEDFALLRAALGGRLHPLPDQCCGFGGPLRLAAPELADAVAARRAESLGSAEQVLTGCTACALELASDAPESTATGHWLEIFM